MDPIVIGVLALVACIGIMFLGMPVPFAMLLTGIGALMLLRSPAAAFQVVASDLFTNFASYTLTVAPMFGFMGLLACYSGIGSSMFIAADKFIGHRKGGIASATQVACAIFGAICGSIPATIATMSMVALPEMNKRGYSPKLSTACIAAGGAIAVLIPPSNTFIIYGIAAEQSIGKLFIAGIIPGIIITLLNIIAIKIVCTRNKSLAPTAPKATWKERFTALKQGGLIEILVIFFVSMGGMFAGWFTATEAASVGAAAVLIVGLIERRIHFKDLKTALFEAAKMAAFINLIIAAAMIFGRAFTLSGIPTALATMVSSMGVAPWVIIAAIYFIYFLMGMVVDALSMVLITIPIFFPIVVGQLGFDPIWFGVIIVLIVNMGGLTPPIGMNVFYMKAYAKEVPLMTIFAGVWPFVVADLICLAILLAFPILCTWLPGLAFA